MKKLLYFVCANASDISTVTGLASHLASNPGQLVLWVAGLGCFVWLWARITDTQ